MFVFTIVISFAVVVAVNSERLCVKFCFIKLFNFEEFPVEKSFRFDVIVVWINFANKNYFLSLYVYFFGWFVCHILTTILSNNVDTIIELNVRIFSSEEKKIQTFYGGMIIWRCSVEFTGTSSRWTTENFVYSSHIDLLWIFKRINV